MIQRQLVEQWTGVHSPVSASSVADVRGMVKALSGPQLVAAIAGSFRITHKPATPGAAPEGAIVLFCAKQIF